jgi:hypothetical protein
VTDLAVSEVGGVSFVEGRPGAPFLTSAVEAGRIIEACWSHHATNALLYAENMPPQFFDLSSGEVGAILQRLRNYGIRLVVVCPPGAVNVSTHFGEMLAEEHRRRHFAVVDTREAALAWLGARSPAEDRQRAQ